MSAGCTIYTLHRWHRPAADRAELVLLCCTRPPFPNWSQAAEDAAVASAEAQAVGALAALPGCAPGDHFEEIGRWEGGTPEGDRFYDPTFAGLVAVWVAWHRRPGYFVFGEAPNEPAFWHALADAEAAGDPVAVDELRRPAARVRALFVRAG